MNLQAASTSPLNNPALSEAYRTRGFAPLGRKLRVLMVWPHIPPSFWSFNAVMPLVSSKAVIPPLGLATIAAICPPHWVVRLVDEAVAPVGDEDIAWADLVMISAMHVQRDSARAVLVRARLAGKRTIIGGPYASSQPEVLIDQSDHVVVGEAEEIFAGIAADLERGEARRLYIADGKPDVTRSPVPRFDLFDLRRYEVMPVQFSRGCPFQCDFCDIITMYGRKPRTKTPQQLVAELDLLRRLGWRKQVFLVDDNFIGNRNATLELLQDLERWQRTHGRPFAFLTEASIDIVHHHELIDAMVRSNFLLLFVGLETPSEASLLETRKLQNLRHDLMRSVRLIQRSGLWVMAGFIVGFDADEDDIFARQVALIESAAIPWAMTGFLIAPPTTPLYARMAAEGRLIEDSDASSNFSPPNFHTRMPRTTLLAGLRSILQTIYDPRTFYERAYRSLRLWKPRHEQLAPVLPLSRKAVIVAKSMWRQGVVSSYRREYWRFLWRLRRWILKDKKLWLGFTLLLSGDHFIRYSRAVVQQLTAEIDSAGHQGARTVCVDAGAAPSASLTRSIPSRTRSLNGYGNRAYPVRQSGRG